MELRIILKDPADGNPLDLPIPAGVWGDYATIAWKFTNNGKDYGEYIEIERGASFEDFEEGVLLALKSAFETLTTLTEGKADE